MYLKTFDINKTGTQSRVSSVLRIINNGREKEALGKIRDSQMINKKHLEAYQMACMILNH
jgi:hypothetical protein